MEGGREPGGRLYAADDLRHAYRALRAGNWIDAAGWMLPDRLGERLFMLHAYRRRFGAWPNTRRPRRIAEHLTRLALSGDYWSPARTRITDKEWVKDFVRSRIGDGYTAKTFAVLRSREEARSFVFPADCAIKGTHDSGSVILRRNGSEVDRARILGWFDRNYYYVARERNYRGLAPKVIVEELLLEPTLDGARDYKVYCFQGVPAFFHVTTGRFVAPRTNVFSAAGNELDCALPEYPRLDPGPELPAQREEMLSVARRLAEGFSFLRVDFFIAGGRVLVGEPTNLPSAGMVVIVPDEADFRLATLFDDPHADVEALVGRRDFHPPAAASEDATARRTKADGRCR